MFTRADRNARAFNRTRPGTAQKRTRIINHPYSSVQQLAGFSASYCSVNKSFICLAEHQEPTNRAIWWTQWICIMRKSNRLYCNMFCIFIFEMVGNVLDHLMLLRVVTRRMINQAIRSFLRTEIDLNWYLELIWITFGRARLYLDPFQSIPRPLSWPKGPLRISAMQIRFFLTIGSLTKKLPAHTRWKFHSVQGILIGAQRRISVPSTIVFCDRQRLCKLSANRNQGNNRACEKNPEPWNQMQLLRSIQTQTDAPRTTQQTPVFNDIS